MKFIINLSNQLNKITEEYEMILKDIRNRKIKNKKIRDFRDKMMSKFEYRK
jgi:hypothetical protein